MEHPSDQEVSLLGWSHWYPKRALLSSWHSRLVVVIFTPLNFIIIILLYNSPLYYSYQNAGYDSCSCEVDADDVRFCFQYATRKKPLPVPSEFITLAEILMRENGWAMPMNCHEALELYFDLLFCIQRECD